MAWTKLESTDNEYDVYQEEITIPDSAGANVVTVYSSTIIGDVSDTEVFYNMEITEASGANGDLTIAAQSSLDGSQWTTQGNGNATRNTSSTGNTGGIITSVAGVLAPYWRFRLVTDGTDILDSATVELRYCVKTSRWGGR